MNVRNKGKIEYIPKYRQMEKIQDLEYEKIVKKESLDRFMQKYIKLKQQLNLEEQY